MITVAKPYLLAIIYYFRFSPRGLSCFLTSSGVGDVKHFPTLFPLIAMKGSPVCVMLCSSRSGLTGSALRRNSRLDNNK